jgi:hypothetical protein
MELMATRIAPYSPSPPDNPIQMRTLIWSQSQRRMVSLYEELTMAIHLASPTRMRPSRSPASSGRNAQAKAIYKL